MKTVVQIIKYLAIYLISFVLISFAITKFFNVQFQITNFTKYTLLKDLPPFWRAWSFFGYSYTYNLFIGLTELAAGILILFSRTRLIGLLIAVVIYSNIVIIDIEFEVSNAILHSTIEFIIVLLLLIPYFKDLKKFFWDLKGRLTTQVESPNKVLQKLLPFIFIIIVLISETYLFNQMNLSGDKIVGAYKVSEFVINNDTLKIGPGKFTKDPMLFFEFGQNCVLSINDSTYWGNYSTKNDSIFINFNEDFKNIKKLKATIDKGESKVAGLTDKLEPFEIKIISFAKEQSDK